METSPGLIRSVLRPFGRRTYLVAVAGATGALLAGLAIGYVVGDRSTTVIPSPTLITVEAPEVSAPVASLNVPSPPAPPAPPPPAPPPPAPPQPAPRALTPYLDTACILLPGNDCTWDDGFPAVSADGALIAMKHEGGAPSDDSSGAPSGEPSSEKSLAITFLDTRTLKVVRHDVLYSLEEHRGLSRAPSQAAVDEAEVERIDRARGDLYGKIGQRIAAVQRMLDGRGFRTLQLLGGNQDGEKSTDKTRVYAQFQDNAVRLIDPARAAVLWQHRFTVTDDEPVVVDEVMMCGGKSLRDVSLRWEPVTGIVLAQKGYVTGGCMCPSGHQTEVLRIPAAARSAPTALAAPAAPAAP